MPEETNTTQLKHARIFDILRQTSRGEAQVEATARKKRELEPGVADALIAQATASLRLSPGMAPEEQMTAPQMPLFERLIGSRRMLRRSSPL